MTILPKPNCSNCGEVLSRTRRTTCSVQCKYALKRKNQVDDWLRDPSTATSQYGTKRWLRDHLMQTTGFKCWQCGWGETNPTSGRVPIELDHIDGNHMNSAKENLRILCPNCHSLTENYKSLNRNKVEESRYKKYREKGWW